MDTSFSKTGNYLVPSSGKTTSLTVSGVFSATPTVVNFSSVSKDNITDFSPQGAFISNSLGTGELQITITNNDYVISVPAGATVAVQFPAPEGQIHSITGNGQASIVYVDFPVIPSSNTTNAVLSPGAIVSLTAGTVTGATLAAGTVAGATLAAGTVTGATLAAGTVTGATLAAGTVTGATLAAGTVSGATVAPNTTTVAQGFIAATVATVAIVVPFNKNLRKLIITLSDNSTLAVAATDLLTVLLNAVNIYQQNLYIPAGVTAGIGGSQIEIDFDLVAPNSGAAGTLNVTLAAALATGIVDVNAYFD